MLFVCPTPIGNLGDITLRVLETLKSVNLVAAEDTRRTRKLLSHFGISKPLTSFFEHNELKRLPDLLDRLRAGEDIALVSDAGMPGICDPGYSLIKAALDDNLAVEVLPGPSALETALIASGFTTDSFLFLGYLPRRKGDLEQTLGFIARQGRTCIAYESPHRLAKTLNAAASILGSRDIAICRELTKKFEEINRGPAASLASLFTALPDKIRGEIVLVFEGATEMDREEVETLERIEAALRVLLDDGVKARSASEAVALATGLPKNRIYKAALALKTAK